MSLSHVPRVVLLINGLFVETVRDDRGKLGLSLSQILRVILLINCLFVQNRV